MTGEVLASLAQLPDVHSLLYILAGALFGLLIGVMPGIGGHFAMALIIPFLFVLPIELGVPLLLGTYSTVAQGGALTTIYFSIPGTGQNAATVLEGEPLRQQGNADFAAFVALLVSVLGATIGALAFGLLFPFLRALLAQLNSLDIACLALGALVLVAVKGPGDTRRNLVAGSAGLVLAMLSMNVDGPPGEPSSSLPIVPIVLGLYAIASIAQLWLASEAHTPDHAAVAEGAGAGRLSFSDGLRAVVSERLLILRCSALGFILGLIPGFGGAATSFVAYSHAKMTAPGDVEFGRGNINGIVAAESANDALKGGALASTIGLGIPSSSSMVILLSGLGALGLTSESLSAGEGGPIVSLVIWSLVFGTLAGMAAGVLILKPLAAASRAGSGYLVPVLVTICITGTYAIDRSWGDVAIALAFGALALVMQALRYSKSVFLVGIILGSTVVTNLVKVSSSPDIGAYLGTLELVVGVALVVWLAYKCARPLAAWRAQRGHERSDSVTGPDPRRLSVSRAPMVEINFLLLVAISLCVCSAGAVSMGATYLKIYLSATVVFGLFAVLQVLTVIQDDHSANGLPSAVSTLRAELPRLRRISLLGASILSLIGLVSVAGYYVGAFAYMFAMMAMARMGRLISALGVSATITLGLFALFEFAFDMKLSGAA